MLPVLLIIVVLIVIAIFTYNAVVSAKNKVEEAKSSIEVYLQNRYDLIPNLVETVKKYMEHEKGVLEEVTKLRSDLVKMSGQLSKERLEKENMLSQTLKSIFAVAENYPDLKANQTFIQLQNQWAEIEDRIAAARRTYNAALKRLRDMQQMIPYSLFAKFVQIPDYEYFEATEEAKKSLDAKQLFAGE